MASWMKDSLGTQLMEVIVGTEYIPPDLYVGLNSLFGQYNQTDYLFGEPESPYIRQACAFEPSGSGIANAEPIVWYDLPGGDLNSIFVSDSPSTGEATVLFAIDLADTYAIASGSGIIIGTGSLTLSFTTDYLIGEGYV